MPSRSAASSAATSLPRSPPWTPPVARTLPIPTSRTEQDNTELDGRQVEVIDQRIRLLGPANLAGLPSLSTPCGPAAGLPVGMQLLASSKDEQVVLDIALAYERTCPLHGSRPPEQQ